MREGPSDKPDLRVIEGGKKELRELPRNTEAVDPRRTNIEKVRKLSPSLDLYLSHRPQDKEERIGLVQKLNDELQRLPAGSPVPYEAVRKRTIEKFGDRPPNPQGAFTWRDRTEEQVEWDEKQALEWANLVAERMEAMAEQQRKVEKLEDHLTDAAARYYRDEDSNPSNEDA
jgi:hypothetical protein